MLLKIGDTLSCNVDNSKKNLFVFNPNPTFAIETYKNYYRCLRFKKKFDYNLNLEYYRDNDECTIIFENNVVYCRNLLIEKKIFND